MYSIKCLGQTVAAAVLASRRHGGLDEQLQFCSSLTELAHAAVERLSLEDFEEAVTSDDNGIDATTLFVVVASARTAAEAQRREAAKEDKKREPPRDTPRSSTWPSSQSKSHWGRR